MVWHKYLLWNFMNFKLKTNPMLPEGQIMFFLKN